MDLTRALNTARTWHSKLYTDTATVVRNSGSELDADGVERDSYTPIADIKCLVQRINGEANQSTSANNPISIATHVCKTALDVDIQPGDILTVTESYDPSNLGTWRVVDVEQQSWSITRKAYLVRVWHSPSTPHS